MISEDKYVLTLDEATQGLIINALLEFRELKYLDEVGMKNSYRY